MQSASAGPMMAAVSSDGVVDEATKKSGLVWISVGGTPPRAAWHLWHEGAAYVVSGGLEQPVPGLAEATTAAVTVRSKDKGGRLVTWKARVEPVEPDGDRWREVAPLLLAKRLNTPDGDAALGRWASESIVCRLVPTGELVEGPGSLPVDNLAEPPRPTPATTAAAPPFTLDRWWRRRRRR